MISKNNLMKEIIAKKIFLVIKSRDKNKWIKLGSGLRTPVFLDTALFNSHPVLLNKINQYIIQIIKKKNIKFDHILGLPYGGLPYAYGVAQILKVPSLALRKEGKKDYGTAGDLLGIHRKNEQVLFIDDATNTADTAIGFVKRLRKDKLIVKDLISIVETDGVGRNNLKKYDVSLHALFTWGELMEAYNKLSPVAAHSRFSVRPVAAEK